MRIAPKQHPQKKANGLRPTCCLQLILYSAILIKSVSDGRCNPTGHPFPRTHTLTSAFRSSFCLLSTFPTVLDFATMADVKSDSVKYALVNHENIPEQLLRLDGRFRGVKRLRAPAVILSTLLVGLAVALAHHFMNVHLDKKSVENVRVSQAWISRISTGLAFLGKLLFTISVGASFTQRLWLRFHQQNFKISEVDAVTSILGNFPSFFSSLVWFRHPILVLTALTSW